MLRWGLRGCYVVTEARNDKGRRKFECCFPLGHVSYQREPETKGLATPFISYGVP